LGNLKIHPVQLDVQQCTPSIVVKIKINRLKEEQAHTLPSVAYLNSFNHLEQEINKMKKEKIAEEKMKNTQ
jgi:hypothetical protein